MTKGKSNPSKTTLARVASLQDRGRGGSQPEPRQKRAGLQLAFAKR